MNSRFYYGGLGARSYASIQDSKNKNCCNMEKNYETLAISKDYLPAIQMQEQVHAKNAYVSQKSIHSLRREIQFVGGVENVITKRPNYNYEEELS